MASAKMANNVGAFLDMAQRRVMSSPSPGADANLAKWERIYAAVGEDLSDRRIYELADEIGMVLPRGMGNAPRKES